MVRTTSVRQHPRNVRGKDGKRKTVQVKRHDRDVGSTELKPIPKSKLPKGWRITKKTPKEIFYEKGKWPLIYSTTISHITFSYKPDNIGKYFVDAWSPSVLDYPENLGKYVSGSNEEMCDIVSLSKANRIALKFMRDVNNGKYGCRYNKEV